VPSRFVVSELLFECLQFRSAYSDWSILKSEKLLLSLFTTVLKRNSTDSEITALECIAHAVKIKRSLFQSNGERTQFLQYVIPRIIELLQVEEKMVISDANVEVRFHRPSLMCERICVSFTKALLKFTSIFVQVSLFLSFLPFHNFPVSLCCCEH
jgi:hypothetical protein